MAPVTFHLIVAREADAFLSTLRTLAPSDRPIYVGQCHHWIHAPHELSIKALLGDGQIVTKWDYLLINEPSTADPLALPTGLDEHISRKWSITAEASEQFPIASYASEQQRRLTATPPCLPQGWSADDHSGLDASNPPDDVEVSLALKAYNLGANHDSDTPVILKDFLRSFGTVHTGPVQMLNLDSSNPGQRPRFWAYIAAFAASVGSKYGGEGAIFANDATDWTSRAEEGEVTAAEAKGYGTEQGQKVGWEDLALVWYPSVWHFAKMLDDKGYAEADRRYKVGVLRDGPVFMCTEVEVDYA